ncbi:MAG: SDR family NAD(P)-dependent oxidoreductase [Propionibacteriaceae bacterium]|jgi:NADP-dependent 3-hydroxy acid dehydrogenase YdfG|nr:SDR family NAD(P)-dependent oxidoreductase [Propionibacteriaceae bacterium]
MRPIAVVTGASSGLGAATARALSDRYTVYCAARRLDRLQVLAGEIGGIAIACDVTDPESIAHLSATVGDRVDLLVNNAGGAFGQEPLATDDLDRWTRMYAVNVRGAAQVTQALLPALVAAHGSIVFVTSTAAETAYEGGGGYCGVKSAERAMAGSLRLELSGQPVRVMEISPGMVHTKEFSLTRFDGDQARADAVYADVPGVLVAEDIAETIAWMANRPPHVNIDRLVIRPLAQAANFKVFHGQYPQRTFVD